MFGDFIYSKSVVYVVFCCLWKLQRYESESENKRDWLQISQGFLHYCNAMVTHVSYEELEKERQARIVEFTCLKARIKTTF